MEPRAFYNAVADIYDQRHDSPATQYLRAQEDLLKQKYVRGRVLDVGCGTGTYLLPGIVGIDVSEGMLKKARVRSASVVQGNEQLPFRDRTFDTVLCMFTVANMCNPVVLASETFRILKPGGRLLMSVASRHDNKGNRVKAVHVSKKKLTFPLFSKRSLLKYFSDFRVEEFRGVFIDVIPDWGGFRPISIEDQKLLDQEHTRPQDRGRLYLVAFRRPL